jgi:hypothetical protein
MAYDVFISHSSKDKAAADAVCALLESDGLRCWIAPRDVQAGVSYAGAIIDAINGCRAMVLIFSDAANASPQIEREIERAANRQIPLLPFRIENVAPQHGLEYFLSTPHWLDAFTPPLEAHIRELARQLHALLDIRPSAALAPDKPAAAPTAGPPAAAAPARSRTRTAALVAIAVVLGGGALAAAGGAAVWLGGQHQATAPAQSAAPVSGAAPPPASAANPQPASAIANSSSPARAVAARPPPRAVGPIARARGGMAGARLGPPPGRFRVIPPPPRFAMQRPPPRFALRPPFRRRPPPPPFRGRRPFG